jgi:hypothetical protein
MKSSRQTVTHSSTASNARKSVVWGNVSEILKIRELKNPVAHTYANDKMIEIYTAIAPLFPALSADAPKDIIYANDITRRYPA